MIPFDSRQSALLPLGARPEVSNAVFDGGSTRAPIGWDVSTSVEHRFRHSQAHGFGDDVALSTVEQAKNLKRQRERAFSINPWLKCVQQVRGHDTSSSKLQPIDGMNDE
jgi:hypothetical protein